MEETLQSKVIAGVRQRQALTHTSRLQLYGLSNSSPIHPRIPGTRMQAQQALFKQLNPSAQLLSVKTFTPSRPLCVSSVFNL